MYTFILCLILLAGIYLKLTSNHSYWSRRKIPHQKPFLFFGNLYENISGSEHFIETLRKIYYKFQDRPYFGMYMLNTPVLVIKDPQVLRKVLTKDFDKFSNYSGPKKAISDQIIFHSLLGSREEKWKALRSKLSPVFSSGKLKLMFPLMVKCCEDFNALLDRHNGEVLDIRIITKKLTVDLISSCAFGINAFCLKDDEETRVLKMVNRLMDTTRPIRNLSILSHFYLPKIFTLLRLTFADKIASDYLVGVFKESYEERKRENIVRNDLVDHLHSLMENDYQWDDVKMASQAITFFFGGNDTSAITMTFALYEMALNPKLIQRLREEIQGYETITYETVQQMKYLDMIVCETLRKYPVGSCLVRASTSSYWFEPDFVLEKDMNVLVPISVIHHDEKYFPHPQIFDPERFNEENRKNILPYTYMPFGKGPRNCLGQRFGQMVVKLALIYAIKNFDFEICDQSTVPMELDKRSTILLQPKDNKLFLKVVNKKL